MKKVKYFTILLTILLSITCTVLSFASIPRDYVDYYINWYGSIKSSEDTKIAKTHHIFERIKKVADKNPKFLNPKLVILKNKGRNPWARALRDGHIVLWQSAIQTCYQQANAQVEACLAFVLGHELGHLAKDDYWHLEMDCLLSGKKCTQKKQLITKTRLKQELAADGEGYAYAAMAGYPVNLLLSSTPEKKGFLTHWLKKRKPPKNSVYPPLEKREAVLREYLQTLQSKITFFDFGVRLSHFDRCDDGEYFLREFQQSFPAREVLNNIGLCYLQRARQEMDSERADFYWMPQVLDTETLATPLVRGDKHLKTLKQAATSRQGEGFLKEAVVYLKQAIEADRGYVPARINLAVTYLYLGKPHKARSLLEEVDTLAPDNLEIQGLQALALYEQSEVDIDLWPRSVARLEKLSTKYNVPSSVLYNLARLFEIRPRPAKARYYWNRIAYVANTLPDPIRTIVCRHQSAVKNCNRNIKQTLHKQPPWKWPIPFEWQPLSEQMAVMDKLYEWGKPIAFNWYRGDKLRGHIYQHPNTEVLELDDYMQMQVLKGDDLGTVNQLPNYCGQPLRKRTLATGVLWSCGEWTALAFDNKIREVWRILR
ncbi:tetratricopeptide repeat protein [Candidatus Parabeggiatoa sp. HSG14]|uniref:tetratricopeptide repeat protein n=1 Tax=Candidatus Parabeggiatoa sp. HSG14 TaxID=3055593 RepID=UPI0025A83495|nr:tetratricopeptide repeat protein [Thiotrichales bacterium HSG14]